MPPKKKRRATGILGVPRSAQVLPFGKHSELFASDSDSSDSDYCVEDEEKPARSSRRERPTLSIPKDANHTECMENKQKRVTKARCAGGVQTVLPIEVLLKVFHLAAQTPLGMLVLSRVARVCWQWNKVAHLLELWERIDLSFMKSYRRATSATLKTLVTQKGVSIKELNVFGWTKLSDDDVKFVVERCPKLSSVVLSKCQLKEKRNLTAAATSLLANHGGMEKVDLSWIQTDATSNQAIRGLLHANRECMVNLNLAGCSLINSAILPDIQLCKNLSSLDVSNTAVVRLVIEDLQRCCPLLEEIYLTNLQLQCGRPTVPLEMPPTEACFTNLRVLSVGCIISSISSIGDDALSRFLHGCCQLQTLDLRGLVAVTHLSIEGIESPSLQRLFLSRVRISPMMLKAILSKWSSSLVELDLGWTVFAEDTSHRSCAASFVEFKMPNLQLLHLQGTSISNEEVRFITRWSPSLSYLDLTSCRGVNRGCKRCHGNVEEVGKLRKELNTK